jgi:hypothetical protein
MRFLPPKAIRHFLSFGALFLLCSCSSEPYQVNPKDNLPEERQDGYMRIIGDLRWDKLTSLGKWEKEFPRCVHREGIFDNSIGFGAPNNMFSFGDPNIKQINVGIKDCGLGLGGINFIIRGVTIDKNAITGRQSTREVELVIPDPASRRAFHASIRKKYSLVTDSDSTKYCSKYTCFELNDGIIYDSATPTPYVISILDAVNLDPSKF